MAARGRLDKDGGIPRRGRSESAPVAAARKHIPEATQAALWALSRGKCYAPKCEQPVVIEIEPGVFRKNAYIAHIHGVGHSTARYSPKLPDDEREAFSNLLLLCRPHHDEVDDRKTGAVRYPADILRQWKADREGEHAQVLAALGTVDDKRLEALLAAGLAGPLDRLEAVSARLEYVADHLQGRRGESPHMTSATVAHLLQGAAPYSVAVYSLPPRNPDFTGRVGLIEKVEQALMDGLVATVALHGLGGVGKSQLAAEISHRGRRAGRYDLVGWIRAETVVTLIQDLAALAPALGVPDTAEHERLAAAVLQQLNSRDRWLLVYDNALGAEPVRNWLPAGDGHVLITSRSRGWGGLARSIPVSEFAASEALAYLAKRVDGATEQHELLAETLGFLPLALAQATSYMDRNGTSVAGYLRLYGDREGGGHLLASGLPNYPGSVATTWLIHIEQMQAQAPAALQLLRLCAFCHSDDIDVGLLSSRPSTLNGRLTGQLAKAMEVPTRWEATVGRLIAQGLATRLDDQRIKLHRLVSEVTRHHLRTAEPAQKRWAVHVLNVLNALTPDEPSDPQSWPVCAKLAPHLLAAAEHAPPRSAAGVALLDVGQYLESRAEYHAAQQALLKALAITQQVHGPDDSETARTLGSLGIVQHALDDLPAAHASQQRALAIYEAMGDDDDIARTLDNLGIVQKDMGELQAARTSFARAVALKEEIYGPNDPSLARTLNNFGNLYGQLGDLDAALATLQRALRIKETHYGRDHAEIAPTLGNLGNLQRDMGDLDAAHSSQLRALDIFERELGATHPETAVCLTNLGVVQDELGDRNASRLSLLRAIAIFEMVYGANHPGVARALVSLGIVEHRIGMLDNARISLERALKLFQERYGQSHSRTAYCRQLLAKLTDDPPLEPPAS